MTLLKYIASLFFVNVTGFLNIINQNAIFFLSNHKIEGDSTLYKYLFEIKTLRTGITRFYVFFIKIAKF